MQRILLVAATASLLGAGTLLAQTPAQAPAQRPPQQGAQRPQGPPQPPAAGPGEIRGTVVDAGSGAPVPSASVAVRTTRDSALVAGAIARADGTFRIEGLRPGSYVLRVNMMGYAAQTTTFAVTPAAPRTNAGSIRLARSAVTLDAIQVTGQSQPVSIAPDRNAYRTRDVAPAATSASEVLEAVPSVQVDADGRVSLRGNESVVVQINGRPTPISGAQLAAYLKQLPASTLERVEVIPNPSARYDPEGMAGIINIVLKQGVDLGWSGGFQLGASTADRYVGSGNLGYQAGPVTLFANYGYSTDDRTVAGLNDRTRLGAGRAPLSYTEQDIRGANGNAGHNLNASLDYRLNGRDVVSNAIVLNLRDASEDALSAYDVFNGSRLLTDEYQRVRDSQTDAFMADYSLAFRRTLQPQRHEFSAELRANRLQDEDRVQLWRQSAPGVGLSDAELNRTTLRMYQFTAQADYTRSFGQRSKLETGYKGTSRLLDRDFAVREDPLGTGTWTPSDLSNALEFDETVNAVYGVFSRGSGKLELQGGLRAEYASRDFSLANSGENYPYDYTSFFPSGLVSYNLSDRTNAKLSYSRRINRPGSGQLNPFPTFFDLQNVFLGNPRLNPEYTDAIELGLQHSGRLGSLQFSPFYRRTTDIIRTVVDTDDVVNGREVTSVSFKNLDTGTSWGADLNGSLRLGQIFNGLAAFNVFKMVTEGTSGESSLSTDAVTWSAKFNATYNMTPRTAFTAQYFYRAPMQIEGGRFDAMQMANLSVRQKMYGDRANLTLRVSDPFNTQRFRIRAGDDNLIQLTERTQTTRAVHLTLQYTFGRAPRPRQQPQQQQPDTGGTGFGN
ncbi:MAG TPA: TonB-dependent receptor [Longimicrobium sp.]|jgi:outer membrane receptor protein involved in Fe transport|uniref:TonB-dependent receptor domain-containing protein n=1 Tax=Longimicrobium sp. TaxID=2029185 RepID=UPI002EDB0F81